MRAGLAAVCVLIAFVASPVPRTLGQTAKPAASDAGTSNGPPPANSSDANPSAAPAPASAAAPPKPPQASPPPPTEPSPSAPAAPSAQAPTPSPEQNPGPPASSAPAPAPPAPPAKTPPPAAKAPPPTKSVLDRHLILGILGKDVKSAKGEGMGRIVDVIVDWTGQTRAAIIDFGGFLGVGSRRIAVAWNALHFEPEQKGDQITLDLTRDQVKAAPEYKEGQPVVVLGPSGATEPIPYD